ncbi:MAG: 30S ribosome-binding factor RbfA [Clostridia bacterium]|nr:30S ribosome-binding factor RbfA [Clostridia bacterium]
MDRTLRIAGEMQRAISEIIRQDMKDPRLPVVTSVTKVKLTKDLQFAKIYISMFGSPEEKKTGINCLRSSAGYIRTMLGKRMIIRQLPQLNFVIDNSVEEGAAMSKIIDDVIASEKRNAAAAESTGDPENVENS